MSQRHLYFAQNATRRKPPMPFNTYIDDKDMIPTLLEYGWIIWKDTWTDCPYPTYKSIKKAFQHNGNATIFGEMM